ncbi:MAG: phosphotransferase [Subtercola sp.]|nr:phosphotransferase [Subtercola sp.]
MIVGESVWDWDDTSRTALASFLAARHLVDGPVTTQAIGDGHSNLTYLISDGSSRVVVRRPPPPPIAVGANDMLREARFLEGLAASRVPVPRVLAVAQAHEVIDVPFYVMSFADGAVVTTVTPVHLASVQSRREIGFSLVDTLADLHAVDWRAAGMGDLGRPEGFNGRHLARMSRLAAASDGTLPAGFAELQSWLSAHVPDEAGASIVHNDFRIGNTVLSLDSPGRVTAVLDWELATIGDPLFDLGYFLASVPRLGLPLTPTEQLGTAMLEEGYPTRDELASRYADHSGLDLNHLGWYSAFALFKLATLYEYGRRKAATGSGDDYYSDPRLVASFLESASATAAQ